MPSVPSQADTRLAEAAIAADWPTSPSQVQELRERKVLPQTVVIRRGRGVTTSKYPDERAALDVLIAMRRADADIHRHHKAVVVAWMRGASVGDGDSDTDKGLRWSLERVLDELQTRGVDRKHRRTRADEAGPFLNLPSAEDRRLAIEAVSAALQYHNPVRPLSEYVAPHLAEVIRQFAERLDAADALPSDEQLERGVVGVLHGKLPSGIVVDLGTTAAIAATRKASRQDLDLARDTMVKGSGIDLDTADVDSLIGVAIGACSVLIGWAARGEL
jgi:hypothetical protein